MTELKIGAKAPEFSLVDQAGAERTLKQFLNRYTIVYFYPKDDTPGCTLESRELSLSYPKLKKLGATVVGISGGTAASKKKFCDKYDLTIPLLADEDFATSKRYDAYGEKKFMGRAYMGIFRKTFVLDSAGKLLKVYPAVKPEGHADELIEFISGLSAKSPKREMPTKTSTIKQVAVKMKPAAVKTARIKKKSKIKSPSK